MKLELKLLNIYVKFRWLIHRKCIFPNIIFYIHTYICLTSVTFLIATELWHKSPEHLSCIIDSKPRITLLSCSALLLAVAGTWSLRSIIFSPALCFEWFSSLSKLGWSGPCSMDQDDVQHKDLSASAIPILELKVYAITLSPILFSNSFLIFISFSLFIY